jgi:chromosome partitioning protein
METAGRQRFHVTGNKRITGGTEKMRIIAVMSPKGGIGKTTTSDAIAYMLGEEQEKRVLILDGDPQGDTSKTFEAYEPEGTGMSELLERHVSVGGSYRTTDLIRPTQYSHIDIIPANGYLMQTDMKLLLKQEANQVTRLRDALEEISEAYDYCICDCGRLLDMVVINILLAAELVIAPVKVGGYENEAIHNLQEQVDDLREINPELRIKGLVTMRQKNKTSLDFEEWMKTSSGFDMFVTPIRRSIVAEKASMRMAVLPQFSKNCIVSQDYRNVVHELLKELEG